MPPSVSVIICAHAVERIDDLRRAVDSVVGQSLPPTELLVVIDHNEQLLGLTADLPATVVASDGPAGLSGARNTGTDRAKGEIVAFLDDDAVAEVHWLRHLTEPYSDDRVVGVGGWATPVWDRPRPAWFPPEFDWVVGCSHRGLPSGRSEVRNVIGCTMSFRRRAVLDVGGFDTLLGRTGTRPAGAEETELCIRLRQRDPSAVILHQPAAAVSHRVRPERATWSYFLRRCTAEGASKARVAKLVGSGDGLASERAYVASTLPRAVVRAATGLPRAPIDNLGRILAIGGGLLATGGGYLRSSLRGS